MVSRATLEPAFLQIVIAKQYDVAEAYLRNGAKGTALSNGNSALHIAVSESDHTMIALLLKYDTDPSIKNIAGETPIVLAANKGLWDCVITFANAKKEDGGRYEYGNALFTAAEKNHFPAVEALLKAGAVTNWYNKANGNRAVHYAASHNNSQMVSILLQHSADPSIKNIAGETPIVLAANKGLWDCVITFANAKKEDDGRYEYGNALFIAAEKNHFPAVEALLKAGPVTNWYHKSNGNRALHYAASHNNSQMVGILMQHSADPSIKNIAGETPIVLAANKGFWDCVITFANARKDVDGKYEYGNALRLAAYNNHYQAVKALLEAGASTHWSHGDGGNTPLHDAVRHHNAAMVALLKLYKADPNKQNAQHETPVLLASQLKFWDCSLAIVAPYKYLIKEVSDIQLVLFYLFLANKNPFNQFSRLPYDVLKLILNLTFNNLSPNLYDYEIAHTQCVTLRPDRRYIFSVSNFIKNYSQLGVLRQIVKSQSPESVAFVKSLESIVATHEPVDKRADKIRQEIATFTARKGDKTSRAVTLLIKYNLFQNGPSAASVYDKEIQSPTATNKKT